MTEEMHLFDPTPYGDARPVRRRAIKAVKRVDNPGWWWGIRVRKGMLDYAHLVKGPPDNHAAVYTLCGHAGQRVALGAGALVAMCPRCSDARRRGAPYDRGTT